ncbi:MAG TPA: glycosyltransferase family 39 protein [Geminicoccaceae bacterium]|nr:glycosyltransferase family 39 protein [Geminicoccaceae bacterium]
MLRLALLLALLFCAYGMHWGVSESWNPDAMVHRNLFDEDQPPLRPINFLKPPFHTYLSFVLVRGPLRALTWPFGIDGSYRRIAEMLLARLLTAAMFLGQVVLVFVVSRRFFGLTAARVASLLLATSAGFVAFSHFLTADIPVAFWMLLAFWSAQNILLCGRRRDYVLAGLFTGLAAATKYNGLAIGIAIVVAHWLAGDRRLLATEWSVWRRRLFDPGLVLGIGMVVVGFVLGNPYAVLDAPGFVGDFMFNLVTTPVYGGISQEIGYRTFFWHLVEIFGLPASLLLGLGSLYALSRLVLRKADRREADGLLMLLPVIALYYAYFGSFGRLETRFVLPVAPYWLMLIGPLCAAARLKYLAPPLAAVLAYNVVCSLYVGWRFTHDPRMAARAWINEHVAEGSTVEYTPHAPRPDRFIRQFEAVPMPPVSGRQILFRDILGDNPWVADRLAQFEPSGDVGWYRVDALARRRPDYVWIDSLEYERFFSQMEAGQFPQVRRYFADLLQGRSGYAIVFDAVNPSVPWWLYPRKIDFLDNRVTLLRRPMAPEAPAAP